MSENFEPLFIIRQNGPKVAEGTAKVYRDGLSMRLSADLLRKCLAKGKAIPDKWKFYPLWDRQNSILRLQTSPVEESSVSSMAGWFSGKSRKSLIINIRPAMDVLGMSVAETPGIYKAEAKRGYIDVHFKRRLQDDRRRAHNNSRNTITDSSQSAPDRAQVESPKVGAKGNHKQSKEETKRDFMRYVTTKLAESQQSDKLPQAGNRRQRPLR